MSSHDRTPEQSRRLARQSGRDVWDPITRIVGSLGIYTKIDFDNRQVAECHSTSSIFRGYSIFMKGKDPRDAHFITSRICGICGDNHATCATTRRTWPSASARRHGRVDRQPRRGRRVHVRPQHLPGQSGRRRLLRDRWSRRPTRACWEKAENDRGAARRRPRLPHHRRHHAALNPVHRRVLPRDPAGQPHNPRDVLPDGRPARASVDPLSRAASARCPRSSSSPTTSSG